LVFANGVKKVDIVWTDVNTTIDEVSAGTTVTKTSEAIITIDAIRASGVVSIDLKNNYSDGSVLIDNLIIFPA
jgi:hypothetical protein